MVDHLGVIVLGDGGPVDVEVRGDAVDGALGGPDDVSSRVRRRQRADGNVAPTFAARARLQ